MKKLKSYLVLLPVSYEIIMLIAIPLLMAAVKLVYASDTQYGVTAIVVLFLAILEVYMDHWVFGGITSKEFGGIAFLQSSPTGMRILENALLVDIIRRALWYLGIGALQLVLYLGTKGHLPEGTDILLHTMIILGAYIATTLGVWLERFFLTPGYSLVIGYGVAFLSIGFMVFFMCVYNMGLGFGWCLALEIVASAAASLWLLWHNRKRLRSVYYDQTD